MAIVKFSKKEFEKHIRLTKQIEEKISMFGTPLESITKDEIIIEVFPNRPDLLSLEGYIRSFLAFLGKKPGLKQYILNKPLKNYEVRIHKSVSDVRPYTVCAIIKDLKFDDEKIKEVVDIQEKIHNTLGRNRKKIAIGIYPLEKITLPIRYEARKPQDINFMPLEATKEMTGIEILQKHPAGREYAYLLQGKKKFPIFIDADNEILSMPPIINSHKTGKITTQTKDIFIECSGFNLDILKKTLNILITMFADMQGTIYQMKLFYNKKNPEITPNLQPEKIKININNINKLLGLNIQEPEFKKLIEKMGYDYKNQNVLVPSWRTDILHEVDIAEDIAIAYGYENFKPEIPKISTIGQENRKEILKRNISQILAGMNMLEVSTHHLLTKQDLKKANQRSKIEVEKSKTDYNFLRQTLFPSIMKVLGDNIDSEYPQHIFEIGKVFQINDKGKEETGIKESEHLIIAYGPSNFTEIKQILEYFEKMLNLKFNIEETAKQGFIDGRTAKILINKKEVGILGEIHPTFLKNFHIKMPISILEINLEKIFDLL